MMHSRGRIPYTNRVQYTRQYISSSIVLTLLIDYVKLRFGEALYPANLKKIEVGLIIYIYQRLIIGVHSI